MATTEKRKSSSTVTIILAVIGLASTVTVALLQYKPWENHSQKKESIEQKEFKGIVVDELNNDGVSMAKINILGYNQDYFTEGSGSFNLKLTGEESSIRVRVIKEGYVTHDKSYDLSGPSVVIPLRRQN